MSHTYHTLNPESIILDNDMLDKLNTILQSRKYLSIYWKSPEEAFLALSSLTLQSPCRQLVSEWAGLRSNKPLFTVAAGGARSGDLTIKSPAGVTEAVSP